MLFVFIIYWLACCTTTAVALFMLTFILWLDIADNICGVAIDAPVEDSREAVDNIFSKFWYQKSTIFIVQP